jgi:phenol 2-monooxygenase
MVEKGQLARKYLNTYHSERWPVAQRVLSIDKVAAKAASGHESSDYCQVVEKNRLFTSGYGISYEENSKDETTLISKGANTEYVFKAGMRAPNFKVFSFATGKKTRLFDTAKDWLTFTVFILANDLRNTIKTVAQFLDETSKTSTLLPTLHTSIITTSTSDQISQFKGVIDEKKVFLDKLNQAQCHRLYHRKQGTPTTIGHHAEDEKTQLILVRPDGYISAIFKNDDGVALSNNLCQYFSHIM